MRHRVLAVIAGLSVVIAACGGGGSNNGRTEKVAAVATPDGLVAAAAQTEAAKTGHVEMTIATTTSGHQAHIVASGAFDADRHLFSLSMDLSSLLSSVGGRAGASDAGALSSLFDSPIEMVETQDTLYMHFPFFAGLLGAKGEWISIKSDAASTSTFNVADPTAFLDFVRGAGGQVTTVGREQVRGVDTTHLRATISLRDAIDRAPAEARDRLQHAIDQLGHNADGMLDTALPYDVFVDDSGMVRRIAVDFEPVTGSSSKTGNASITIDFFDFGSDVSITPPPPDQVTDVTAKLGQLTGMLGGG